MDFVVEYKKRSRLFFLLLLFPRFSWTSPLFAMGFLNAYPIRIKLSWMHQHMEDLS